MLLLSLNIWQSWVQFVSWNCELLFLERLWQRIPGLIGNYIKKILGNGKVHIFQSDARRCISPRHFFQYETEHKQTTCLWQQAQSGVTCFNSLTSAETPHSFLARAPSSPAKMSLACACGSQGGLHSLLQLSEALDGRERRKWERERHK